LISHGREGTRGFTDFCGTSPPDFPRARGHKAKAKEKQKTEGRELGGRPTLRQNSAKGSINTREELAKTAEKFLDTGGHLPVI
jgi:hypothetical protein